jgi:hypothetical protein
MAFTPFDYMPNYGAMQETEEERRRREAEQQAGMPQAQPVSPQDFGAMPMQEQPVAGIETDFGAMPVQEQPAAVTTPAEPTQPAAGELKMVNGRLQRVTEPEPVTLPEFGPGVQVAGPAQMPPPAPRYTGPSQGAEAQTVSQQQPPTAVAPGFTGQGIQLPGQQPAPSQQPYDLFLSAANDTDRVNKLMGIRNDELQSPVFRRIASAEVAADLSNSTKEADAKERISKMSQTELARELQRKDSEGNWGKRILFGMLGMEAAVKDEEAKLGIGAKWSSVATTDPKTGATRNVLIKTRADGLPMVGYDAESGAKLDAKALAGLPSSTAKLNIVGGTYVNDKTREVGRVITDERTGTSYIQTDSGRKPMSGFRPQATGGTLADQILAAQGKAGVGLQFAAPVAAATAGGKVAGETAATYGTQIQQPQQLPVGSAAGVPAPGGAPVAPAAQAPAAVAAPAAAPAAISPEQSARLQGDLSSLNNELARIPAGDSRRPIIESERSRVLQQLGMPAAPAPVATGRAGAAQTPAQLRMQSEAQGAATTEAAKTPALVARADQEAYIKFKNDELLPKADTGAKLAGIRRDQISGPDGILNNPEIAGLLSGTGGQAREFQNLFRDVVGGSFEKIDDMSTRIKQANLDPKTKEILQIQLQRQREVTPLLIREVAPVGAITDFEQRMAKEAGIDVLRQGLYSSLTNLTRSQFQSDMAAYKAVFAERNPQLRTRAEFDRAWNAEKSRLDASYRKVYEDRAKYLGRYNRDGSNNNATIVAFKDHYPVPAFDPSTGQFRFSGYSRKAERAPLSTFERR